MVNILIGKTVSAIDLVRERGRDTYEQKESETL